MIGKIDGAAIKVAFIGPRARGRTRQLQNSDWVTRSLSLSSVQRFDSQFYIRRGDYLLLARNSHPYCSTSASDLAR
jgi:hypothetical protein